MPSNHLNAIEWLEDMRRFAGRDAERATELLKRLDDVETLNAIAKRYSDILHACELAGLINEGDTQTDVVPLLAMFLPLEGPTE